MNAAEFFHAASSLISLEKKYKRRQAILEDRLLKQSELACKIHEIGQSLEPALRALGEDEVIVMGDYWFSLQDGLVCYDKVRSYLEIPENTSTQEVLTNDQIDEAALHAAFLTAIQENSSSRGTTKVTSSSIIPMQGQGVAEVRLRDNLTSEGTLSSSE